MLSDDLLPVNANAEIAKTMLYPAAMKVVATEANALMAAVADLEGALARHDFDSAADHMRYCAGPIRGLMDAVRAHGDVLETEVADDHWPLPKYREMLFIR